MQALNNRHNIYYMIHKALRLRLGQTLQLLGSTDWRDTLASQTTLAELRQTLDWCESHLQHENQFIHPALENHYPGTAGRANHDHDEHLAAIADLRQQATQLAGDSDDLRQTYAGGLYQQFALFVGENLCHMQMEETAHNAVLWHAFTDEQILGIEQALVASIPAEEKMAVMLWMLRAATPAECGLLLQGLRAQVPAEVWPQIEASLLAQLSPADQAKLHPSQSLAQAA